MSTLASIRQESAVKEVKQVTLPTTTYRSYTRAERPDAYQFWHQKGKQNSYQTKVLSTNYKLATSITPGQTIQLGNGCGPQVQGCCGTQGSCQQTQPVVRLNVVSRDEIEAPWRDECLYLQALVSELEKKKEVQIVREVDNTRVNELLAQNERLHQLIQEAESETITQTITETNNEVEVWKRRYNETNANLNDTQSKLNQLQIELDLLKKQKQAQSASQSSVKRTVVTTSGSQIRSSDIKDRK